jgi:hypothetical protein
MAAAMHKVGEEIRDSTVVYGGDAAKIFEAAEHALDGDQMESITWVTNQKSAEQRREPHALNQMLTLKVFWGELPQSDRPTLRN